MAQEPASTSSVSNPSTGSDPSDGDGAAPGSRASHAEADDATPPVLIQARPGWQAVDLAELWRYRHLLWILALRNVQVRYKQTVMGGVWALMQPVVTMVVFTTLFYLLGRNPVADDDPTPYAVTLYCALLPWQLFAASLQGASSSLVQHKAMITKVYFPRLIVVFTPAVTALIDFALAFVVLVGMLAWFGIMPGVGVLALPLFLGLAMLSAWSLGLWLAGTNALYRDVNHGIPFAVRIMMFLTPVIYTTEGLIPEQWQWLYSLNPMATVIEGFRWAILGNPAPALGPALGSIAIVLVVLAGGLFYFRRIEATIADRV